MSRTRSVLTAAALATIGGSLWARKHPSACPYALRFFVEAPHPGISRSRLLEALAPLPGERILEIGPGTGYYSVDVAARLEDGTLSLFDIQQEFLDHTAQAAAERGVTNLEPKLGNAERLPYEDASFDAAYLVTVLGEVPDQDAALRELHRVLRPSGRLVVGETIWDPHIVFFGKLRPRAEGAGFTFERRFGSPLGFFARFRK
jgi:SAM-dependent methyltransferase